LDELLGIAHGARQKDLTIKHLFHPFQTFNRFLKDVIVNVIRLAVYDHPRVITST
jgi:hypothetical protein